MEYTIVKAGTTEALLEKVNELIAKGWMPLGGMAVTAGSTFSAVYQAMIKQKQQAQ